MLRRLMVAVSRGQVALDVSKELRETAKQYSANIDKDVKDTKIRQPIDVSGLRSMAQQDPNLLSIIAPLLSDDELNEIINGSQDPSTDQTPSKN